MFFRLFPRSFLIIAFTALLLPLSSQDWSQNSSGLSMNQWKLFSLFLFFVRNIYALTWGWNQLSRIEIYSWNEENLNTPLSFLIGHTKPVTNCLNDTSRMSLCRIRASWGPGQHKRWGGCQHPTYWTSLSHLVAVACRIPHRDSTEISKP